MLLRSVWESATPLCMNYVSDCEVLYINFEGRTKLKKHSKCNFSKLIWYKYDSLFDKPSDKELID